MRTKSLQKFLSVACTMILLASSVTICGAGSPAPIVAADREIQELFASAARASVNGTAYELKEHFNQLTAYLDVTAKNATSLDLKIQDSVDNSIWTDLGGCTFTQVTTTTASQVVNATRAPAKYIRAVSTVVGTTFTFSVRVMLWKSQTGPLTVNALDASTLTSGTLPTTRLSEDIARTVSVTIPTASVLTLNSTPFTLVAAPGAGKIVLVDEITAKLVFNSVAYTGSNALEWRYTNGSGAKVTADIASSFINSASGTNYASVKSVVTALTPVANALICAFVPTANPGAGNSDIVVTIKYRIVTP